MAGFRDIVLAKKPVYLLFHLGFMLLLIFLAAFIFFKVYLPATTDYGETIAVPEVEGKSLFEAEKLLRRSDLRFEIYDSTYKEDIPAFSVLRQHPLAGSQVKKNRKVYLTISAATPPEVKVPPLVGDKPHSLQIARKILKSKNLKVGDVEYIHHPNKFLVLEMSSEGKKLSPGQMVPVGTEIDLKVGNGEKSEIAEVPLVEGFHLELAREILEENGLTVGTIAREPAEGVDDDIVIRQSPGAGEEIPVTQPVDLWVKDQAPF